MCEIKSTTSMSEFHCKESDLADDSTWIPSLCDSSFQSPSLDSLFYKDTSVSEWYATDEYKHWKQQFANSYSRLKSQDSKYWTKKNICINFMFQLSLRMKSIHNVPRMIAQLSIYLYQHGCSMPVWTALSKLKVVLSYQKTKQLLKKYKHVDIPKKLKWKRHRDLMVIGADNCSYYNGNAYQRHEKGSHFIQTINYYEIMWNTPPKLPSKKMDGLFPASYLDNELSFRFANSILRFN